jgi:hypothetical protein
MYHLEFCPHPLAYQILPRPGSQHDMRLNTPLSARYFSQRYQSTNAMAPYLTNGTVPVVQGTSTGDLNNVSAMRAIAKPIRDPDYAYRTLAIPAKSEDSDFRQRYRPFLLDETVQSTDWVSQLELATATQMAEEDLQRTGQRLRVLVIYGSLRKR